MGGDDDFVPEKEEEIALEKEDLFDGIGTEGPMYIYLEELSKIPPLSADEEIDFAKRMEEGDDCARDRLTEANLWIVVCIAKRYTGMGMSLIDLVIEGNQGLVKGLESFHYTSGYKLAPYLARWIRQAIVNALANQDGKPSIPVYLVESICKTRHKLTRELGHEPSAAELAAALDMPEEKIAEIIQTTEDSVSPAAPPVDNKKTIRELFEISAELREHIDFLLQGLNDREKQVVIMRLGLEDGQPRTLEEVSRAFNVTRERVRQIEVKALRKFPEAVLRKKIRIYFE